MTDSHRNIREKRELRIIQILNKEYPDADIALNFSNNFQLLTATILSAQCTDQRVNVITASLFRDYPYLFDYLSMDKDELIRYIRSAGFYNNKARSILGAAEKINRDFGGKVPDNMKDLLSIPGVARKTANVVLSAGFGKSEGIAVDTHVKRLSGRLGLSKEKTLKKIERDLMGLYPKKMWGRITHLLITHGRSVCKARNPSCQDCSVLSLCPKIGVGGKK